MARQLRLHVPGGFYHVTLRGNHRQPIFFTEADRDLLDTVVAEVSVAQGARIHAFCWMTNHLHMLVQVSDEPLGRLILRVASRYARSVQARLATTGHLFERRYHSVLVDADSHLLELIRYIHLNPVRAGLVVDPSSYPWSSHRVYLGSSDHQWVTTDFVMRMLAAESHAAIARYREFMGDPEPCRWGHGALTTHHRQILGSDEFAARILGSKYRPRGRKSLDELINECCGRFGVSSAQLESRTKSRDVAAARAWVAHEAVAGGVASMCAVARRFNRSESTIRELMSRHPHARDDH